MFVFVCDVVVLCVCEERRCICVCKFGAQRLAFIVSFEDSALVFRDTLSLGCKTHYQSKVSGRKSPGILVSPSLHAMFTTVYIIPGFLCGFWILNSGPHTMAHSGYQWGYLPVLKMFSIIMMVGRATKLALLWSVLKTLINLEESLSQELVGLCWPVGLLVSDS